VKWSERRVVLSAVPAPNTPDTIHRHKRRGGRPGAQPRQNRVRQNKKGRDMQERKGIDGQAFGMMVMLCMIWAFQQIAIKAAAVDVAPVLQIAIRSGVAAVLVTLLMVGRREPLNISDGSWRPGLLVGVLFGLEFLLVGEGLRYTTASHMAVFLYTAPFFAAVLLHCRLSDENFAAAQGLGILAAFTGTVVAFAGRDAGQATPDAVNMLLGDFLGLLAGAAWGATTVVIRC